MLIKGRVARYIYQSLSDQAEAPATMTKQGALVTADAMGKYGVAARGGSVFYMATVIAGVAVPVNAATLVSKFTLWNPAGSGVIVEPIEFTYGIDSATEVVNGLALAWQERVTSTGGAPGTLTATVNGPASTNIGAGDQSACKGYTAATLTNAAVLPVYPLGLNMDATAVGRSGNGSYNFDGKFWVPPDTLITFVTTVAPSTAMPLGLTWQELPL